MAKDKIRPTTSTSTPATPATQELPADPVVAKTAVETSVESSGSTEMTSAPMETELATATLVEDELAKAPPDSLSDLFPVLLPHLSLKKRAKFLALRKVHTEEFEAGLGAVPEALRANFQELMERMNPDRETREMGEPKFRPATLRLYQGVGEKPKNPKLPKGGVEDGSGNIVLVPETFKDDFEGVPQKLVVSILLMSEGRAFWPPRGPDGQPQIPAGIDIKGNQMICGSSDRVMGTRYGKCDACPYKPDFGKKEKGCKDNVDLFVVKPDLSAIYQITLGATSFRTCSGVILSKANGWRKDYAGQFALEPQLIEKPGQSYYVWKAGPVTSRQEPNGVMNSAELQAMFALLVRQIQTEVYYPRLANNYARAGAGAEGNAPGSLGDVEAAAAGMDYSGSGGASGGNNNINA